MFTITTFMDVEHGFFVYFFGLYPLVLHEAFWIILRAFHCLWHKKDGD